MQNNIKKSYNPFKMIGSWIGAVIGGVTIPFGGWILGIAILNTLGLCGEGPWCIDPIYSIIEALSFISQSMSFTSFLYSVIIWTLFSLPPIILGFVIGWIIHCLIRKCIQALESAYRH